MGTSFFSTVLSVPRWVLTFLLASVRATLAQLRRMAVCGEAWGRVILHERAAMQARRRLGQDLWDRQRGDEECRQQITSLEKQTPSTASPIRRLLLRLRRGVLLRRLANSTLRLPEPPPGVGDTYQAFRRALFLVTASRARLSAAWVALPPQNRWEASRVGFGTAVLCGLALVLARHGSRVIIPAPEVIADRTRDEAGDADTARRTLAPPNEPPTIEALPDGPPDPTPAREMTETLAVDLQADPRQGFTMVGPVEWTPGRLTLAPGGMIRRRLDLGAQAIVTLRLALTPLNKDGQTATTRFAFQLRSRGDFIVEIVRQREGGRELGEVRLIDRDPPDEEKRTSTLRTFKWQDAFPNKPWTFRLHHGLLTVHCGGKRLAIGYADKEPGRLYHRRVIFYGGNASTRSPYAIYTGQDSGQRSPTNPPFYKLFGIDEPLEICGWSLEQQGASAACLGVSGSASPSYRAAMAGDFRDRLDAIRLGRIAGFPMTDEINDLRARIDHQLRRPTDDHFASPVVLHWEKDERLTPIRSYLGTEHPYYTLALVGGGLQHHWAGYHEMAEKLLLQAIDSAEKSLGRWHPEYASAVSALGRVYRDTGQLERAEPLLTKALQVIADVFGEESARHALALQELAEFHQFAGRFAAAEMVLRRALDASKDAPARGRANALIMLGDLETRMGERDKAAASLGHAQKILERLAQEALTSFRTGGNRDGLLVRVDLANIKARRGWVLFHAGQKEAARKLIREAFLSMVMFHGAEATTPGSFRGWKSDIRNILPNNSVSNHPRYSQVMVALGELFITLGDVTPACRCVEMADLVAGSFTPHDRSVLYRTMARLYASNPNLVFRMQQGFSNRQRLETILRLIQPGSLSGPERQKLIAGIQLPGSVPEEQMRELEAKAKLRGQSKWGKPDFALDWQQIALREFERYAGRDHFDTIRMLQDQGRREWQVNGLHAAIPTLSDAFTRAIGMLSDRVLAGLPEAQAYQFLEANQPPTDLLLSCYQANKEEHGRDAYEVVWRAKALATRQLAERRQLLQTTSGRSELGELAAELQTTRQQLAELSLAVPSGAAVERRRERLAKLTQHKEDLERELARLSESFRRTRDAARASVADIARRLPPRTAVVDFVERWQVTPSPQAAVPWSQTRCYDAFVLRRDSGEPGWSATWIMLGDADALDQVLDDWVAGVLTRRPPDRGLAEQLRRRLWAPIEAVLTDCKTVILIPDGRLSQVPWGALPGRRANSYLIEDYELAQAPYGQYVARLLMDPPPEGDGLLLMGGLDYGPPGEWSYLPGTADEVNQLEQLRPGAQTVRLGGKAATKARLLELLPGRRYVHLATHGKFLNPVAGRDRGRFLVADSTPTGASFDVTARNPLLLSMLVLAGANWPVRSDVQGLSVDSDSFLTAEEVLGLDLTGAELVVLSACETSAGKVRSGEGVFSLQRAFHVAGSRAIVATLWQVHDESTRRLMLAFYRNLWDRRQPMGKLEALRAAQLDMIRHCRLDAATGKVVDVRGGVTVDDPDARRKLEEQLARLKDSGQPVPPFYWAAFVLSGDWR
jgi:CHAT domain-containing protein